MAVRRLLLLLVLLGLENLISRLILKKAAAEIANLQLAENINDQTQQKQEA